MTNTNKGLSCHNRYKRESANSPLRLEGWLRGFPEQTGCVIYHPYYVRYCITHSASLPARHPSSLRGEFARAIYYKKATADHHPHFLLLTSYLRTSLGGSI